MENFKVKVNSEAESKEVQELFFELGCYIDHPKKCLGDAVIIFSESCGLLTYSSTETYTNDGTPYKEITPQQLRDLVVLKRNDKNDATHSNDGESGLAVMLGGVWYGYNFNEKKWESWVDDDEYKLKDLKPIEKPMTETEYLMQGKNGENLMESVGQLKGSQWDLQVGGNHYKSMKIQPAKFALENKLDYCQSNAIKYICRHESKNGKQDLEKAKHYIDLLIEHYYGDQNAI